MSSYDPFGRDDHLGDPADAGPEPEPRDVGPRCSYCGVLGWTRARYGQELHKHACPHREDAACQTHPDGCPGRIERHVLVPLLQRLNAALSRLAERARPKS